MKKTLTQKILSIIFIVIGVSAGLYILVAGTMTYFEEKEQESWILTSAVICDISRSEDRNDRYDITYEYTVDGEDYQNSFRVEDSRNTHLLGDEIKIRYNPSDFSQSTSITKSSVSELLVVIFAGLGFIVMGLIAGGVFSKFRRKIFHLDEIENDDVVKEYTYKYPRDNGKKSNVLRTLLPIALIVAVVFGSVYFSAQKQKNEPSVSDRIGEFSASMFSNGYESYFSTSDIEQEFRIGSLLEMSCSVNTEDLRIDYCIMKTGFDASKLYDGMSLPVSGNTHNGRKYVTAENDEMFCLKLQDGDVVIYAASTPEQKTELLRLLNDVLGYEIE